MANQIRLKRGSGSDPSASDLAVGEVAVRTDNGKLFTKKDNGSVAEISGGGGIDDGDKGDITVSNSGATFTIDNGVVNDAKVASDAAIAGSKLANPISLADDHKISFGTGSGNNLEIFHESSSNTNEIIAADGDIHIQADNFQLISDDSGGRAIFLDNSSGHLELGFDGNHCVQINGSQTEFIKDVKFDGGTAGRDILFDRSDNQLEFADDAAATFGTDDDLKITHSGSNGNITNATGDLVIRTLGTNADDIFIDSKDDINIRVHDTDDAITCVGDGAVTLFHNNSAKFATSSSGGTLTGTLVADGFTGPLTGNVTGNASGSSGSCTGNAATATALETARNIGGVSFDGTGNINLPGVNTSGNQDTSGNAATATALETARTIAGVSFDGTANISLNNNAITNGAGYITATLTNEQVQDIVGGMLSSNTETGITVTYQDGDGTIDFVVASQTDNNFTDADHSKLDGIASGATNVTNNNQLTNGAGYITTVSNSDVASNAQISLSKLETITSNRIVGNDSGNAAPKELTAAEVRSILNVADGATNVTNNNQLTNGAGYITSSSAGIPASGGTFTGDVTFDGGANACKIAGDSDIRLNNGAWTGDYACKLQHHSNYLYIQGGTNGILWRSSGGTNRLHLNSSGHLIPQANNTYDLGSSSNRFQNIYTNDLNLSNEGGSNNVDGTWGDWTLQEGEDKIFMLNNRNGKKYAINLTEIV
jgi:hypothetical protein|tara:strand:- start:291 stop:2429 length:2139 start_codon:yes stop_codon:yes gene_type:complete